MSLGLDTSGVIARYDQLVALVAARGSGLTLRQLGAAHSLARHLESAQPDDGRIGDLCALLELDVEAVR